jgi:predicted permease
MSATIVVSLAAGMTSVVALGGVVDTLLFREPAGIREPSRVVAIGPWAGFARTTYPDYVDLRDRTRTLESVGAFAFWNYTARVGSAVAPARGLLASTTLLPTLGMHPAVGRGFTRDEDRVGGAPVVLIGSRFRARLFPSDDSALGGTLRLAGTAFTIIGILPASFTAPDMSPVDLVVPIEIAPWFGGREALVNRDYQWVRILGRLRPGVTSAAASTEATVIYRRMNVGVRSVDQTELAQAVVPVRSLRDARVDRTSSSTRLSLWLGALAALVLLIACANAASLLVARAIRDAHETAIHVALGAGAARLARRALVEVGVLVAVAIAAAIAASARVGDILGTLLLGNTVAAPPVDLRTGAIATAVGVLACVVCALAPVMRAARTSPGTLLGSHSRTTTGSHRRTMRLLVGAQIALGVVLVSEAALFAASLRNATRVDLGFDLAHLVVADVDLRAAGFTDATAPTAAARALDAVRRLPGVVAAGMTNGASVPGYLNPRLTIPGRDSAPPGMADGEPYTSAVTPGFLEALVVPLRRGRRLTAEDVAARRAVAVVSERFATLFWPGLDAIGQCVRVGRLTTTPCAVVVGVVGDRRPSPASPHTAAELYLPDASAAFPPELARTFLGREIAVRVVAGQPDLTAELQRTLLDVIPALTSVRVRAADAYLEGQTRSWRLGAVVIGAFAMIALVLAAVGVFSVWSYAVAARRRELAIRGALGALPRDLAWLVVREALAVGAAGLATGLIAAIAASRVVAAMTFGISPLDPRVFVATAVVFVAVTAVATLIPAIRAALIQPRIALAEETANA